MQTSLLSFFTRTPKGSTPSKPSPAPQNKTPLGAKASNGNGDQKTPVSSKTKPAKPGSSSSVQSSKYPPGSLFCPEVIIKC